MTPIAFFLLFISVFLHAGWNFLSKKTVPSLSFYAISTATAALLWLPGFIWSGLKLGTLPFYFWLIWLCSVGCEVLYLAGLAYAYRRDDISLVYPLTRALPVLMTAVITNIFGLGKTLGLPVLVGMAALSIGCLLIPMNSLRKFKFTGCGGGTLKFIILAAFGTTGYTILDSIAVGVIHQANPESTLKGSLAYLFMVEAGMAASMFLIVCRSRAEHAELRRLLPKFKIPVISGIFSSTAYALILLAMKYVNNVSYIQAFRQMSLPLGVLAGIFLLHEKPGKPRLAGIALVIISLLVISLCS